MAKDRLADWDSTAGNNTDVGGINIDEGWPPENVNNAMREKMAQVADFFKDKTGTITSTNVSNAYSITTNDGVSAYAAGQLYAFIANAANTGAATLNVNTIGAKSIVKNHDLALESGDIEANQICVVAYGATDDTFQLLSQPAQVITEGANVDIANTTAETSIDRSADTILIYDDSASANREAILNDAVGPIGSAAQATTSGTTKDFTGVPPWVKRVHVAMRIVSLDGAGHILVQPGTSVGPITSGYTSSGGRTPTPVSATSTSGFLIYVGAAAGAFSGIMTLVNVDGNEWVASYSGEFGNVQSLGGGTVDLGGALTQIRLTLTSGNFDGGKANISY